MLITGADLLRAVADAIEENPQNYHQASWLSKEGNDFVPPVQGFKLLMEGACGTTACVAGWAVAINAKEKQLKPLITDSDNSEHISELATKLLWPALNEDECAELFDVMWKPKNSKSVSSALRKIAKGKDVREV